MSATARAKEKVLDRIAAARKLGSRYHAEADGLLRALCSDKPVALFSDVGLHQAYLRGFCDGREILRVESLAVADHESVEHPAAHGY